MADRGRGEAGRVDSVQRSSSCFMLGGLLHDDIRSGAFMCMCVIGCVHIKLGGSANVDGDGNRMFVLSQETAEM